MVQRLGEFGGAIRHASEAVAELDCLLSLSLAAREHNLRRPELTKANELIIREGETSLHCFRALSDSLEEYICAAWHSVKGRAGGRPPHSLASTCIERLGYL
jgi:hypothetical protein